MSAPKELSKHKKNYFFFFQIWPIQHFFFFKSDTKNSSSLSTALLFAFTAIINFELISSTFFNCFAAINFCRSPLESLADSSATGASVCARVTKTINQESLQNKLNYKNIV